MPTISLVPEKRRGVEECKRFVALVLWQNPEIDAQELQDTVVAADYEVATLDSTIVELTNEGVIVTVPDDPVL